MNIFFFSQCFFVIQELERLRPAPWEMFYYLFGRMLEHNYELLDHLYHGIQASQLRNITPLTVTKQSKKRLGMSSLQKNLKRKILLHCFNKELR